MGNSSSLSQGGPAEEESVFSLSEELQEKMSLEYNNEQVVKLFGKQMEKLGERKAAALHSTVEQRTKLQQHMEQFREQNKQIQQKLDQAIESSEDRFTDTANVVEYDAARLEKKYLDGKTLAKSKSEIPCFSERANMAICYTQSKNDPQACESCIEALTACADKTITTK